MPVSSDTDSLLVPSSVVARRVGSGIVLLNAATGRYFMLDAVGASVWDLLASRPSFGSIRSSLLAEYDVGAEQMQQDLEALIDALERRGLVKVHRASDRGTAALE